MSLVDLSDIATMLAQDIERLCADVLPSGRREGSEWVEASRSNGGLGDGLKVSLSGARRGVFKHFGDAGSGGDALELIAYVLYGGDKKKAVAYAKDFLGIEKLDPKALQATRHKAQAAAKRRDVQAREELDKKRAWAQSIWHNANPKLASTPVDLYLKGRGIDLDELPKVPGALRFGSKVKHSPSGHDYPAMVAQVNDHSGAFVAVHRTYLAPQGMNYIKAPLGEQSKMVLGSYAGGFIPLNRGRSNKPFKDAPDGDAIILCEGIEDGLSLVLACPDYRVHACISVANFKNICLPRAITEVIIAADNDAPDSPAARAVDQAVQRFMQEGRDVFLAYSPKGKDFNDCLRFDGTLSVREA